MSSKIESEDRAIRQMDIFVLIKYIKAALDLLL